MEDVQLADEVQLSSSQDYASLSHNHTRDLVESYQIINDIFGTVIQPRLDEERYFVMRTKYTVAIFYSANHSDLVELQVKQILFSYIEALCLTN